MPATSFSTETFGKWILVGEHSVLRGIPAIAFPLMSQSFKFRFTPSGEELSARFEGARGEDYRLLFYGVLEHALSRLQVKRESLKGVVEIESSLPVGAGLGASAALCVALTRWFVALGLVEADDVYEFSRSLEDLFHGESSGLDIVVAMKAHGVRYVRGREMKDLEIEWKPNLYVSYCGSKGLTADCVSKVKALFESKPPLAQHLDEQMMEAVEQAEKALTSPESPESVKDLKTSLLLGRDCFERWGLIFGDLKNHIRTLDEAGALAVKPTGSGGGGYVLSLWEEGVTPPKELSLLPVFG